MYIHVIYLSVSLFLSPSFPPSLHPSLSLSSQVMSKIAMLEDERLKLLETIDQMQKDNQSVGWHSLTYMYM